VKWLVDTNIVLISAQTSHPAYDDVARVVGGLLTRGDELFVVAQNLIEFWAVATRPIANNGLGLTIDQATQELTRLKTLFAILPDTADILPEWERLVVKHKVSGKQVYDTRLVAAMSVHGLTHLLTLNTADFKRFITIRSVSPKAIVEDTSGGDS
jgi:predicted nucleic acid-binding protein